MPGAGSLKLANYLYNVAPKDGIDHRHLQPRHGDGAADRRQPTSQFDSTKLTWLGSGTNETSVFVIWHTSPVKTWNDIITKPFTVGGEGSGSDPDIYALLLKNAFGAKLKLISGYPGTAEIAIAIERGEVDSRASWSWTSLKTLKPNWIAEKKVNLPVQLNLTKGADLQDVPLITEFATNDRQRQMLKLILSRQEMARPYAAPPGIPDDRKAALRKAFDDAWADPELRRRDEGARPGGQSGERGGARCADRRALRDAEGCGGGDAARDRGAVTDATSAVSTAVSAFGFISSRAAFTALMMF